jgi:hypothetical protein
MAAGATRPPIGSISIPLDTKRTRRNRGEIFAGLHLAVAQLLLEYS